MVCINIQTFLEVEKKIRQQYYVFAVFECASDIIIVYELKINFRI